MNFPVLALLFTRFSLCLHLLEWSIEVVYVKMTVGNGYTNWTQDCWEKYQ